MDFRVLGPLEVERVGAPVHIGSRMQRRLLALLLLHTGVSVRAEHAVDVLWGEQPPPSATKGLHTYLSRLRRVLGEDGLIESGTHGYRLRIDDRQLDARRFERLVATAREQLGSAPAEAAAGLAEALALWQGPAYGEFADEEFARAEALRLDELRLTATEAAFDARLALGDTGLVADLTSFADAHPLRERPHLQLMTALSHAGRQTEALEVYQRVRRRLADESGLDPSPALQQLQGEILRRSTSVTTTAGNDGRDDRVERPPGNLPRPITSFVGRRHETEAVCRLLERDHLVTLTGVGGVGKTRLALQAAAVMDERYPDGVWWCELAPTDPEALTHVVADILGVHQQASHSLADSIVSALADKRLLLVLDNCEHVVEASAQLTELILRTCPQVTILATSREPLTVDGEQVWHVPPLPLPSDRADDRDSAPSARLFYDRASAYHADVVADQTTATAVADICRKLDGLPLAIELAAALVSTLAPAEIARRLGQRFQLLTHGPRTDPRHRSLTAVVRWSYLLLDPAEQRLFDRLAVFAGGFTLPEAEGICTDDDLAAESIAGLLAGLVSRSMIEVDRSVSPVRYRQLETLRHYAEQRLAERGEEATMRARHAAWFVEFAERADAAVRGPDEAEAVMLLEAELANLRGAHRWTTGQGDADLALRLTAALYIYARFRLHDEVFVWAEETAALPAAAGHPLMPTVWGIAAHGRSNRGDLTSARELAEHAIAAAPGPSGQFVPLRVLATTALHEGRLDDCRHYTQRAVASARRDGDTYHRLWMQMHEVLALVYGGQQQAGLDAALKQQAAGEQLGNPTQRAWTLYGHAEACGDEDPETALRLLDEVIALAGPVRGRFLEGVARVASTSLLARHHSPYEALAAFPDIIRRWHRRGDWVHQWTTLRNLVPLLVRVGADHPAARLYGAQDAAGAAAPAYGDEAARLAEAHDALTERLGTARFEALVEQGQALNASEVVDVALTSIATVLDARGPADSPDVRAAPVALAPTSSADAGSSAHLGPPS